LLLVVAELFVKSVSLAITAERTGDADDVREGEEGCDEEEAPEVEDEVEVEGEYTRLGLSSRQ
jgi:hypothetical protein